MAGAACDYLDVGLSVSVAAEVDGHSVRARYQLGRLSHFCRIERDVGIQSGTITLAIYANADRRFDNYRALFAANTQNRHRQLFIHLLRHIDSSECGRRARRSPNPYGFRRFVWISWILFHQELPGRVRVDRDLAGVVLIAQPWLEATCSHRRDRYIRMADLRKQLEGISGFPAIFARPGCNRTGYQQERKNVIGCRFGVFSIGLFSGVPGFQ